VEILSKSPKPIFARTVVANQTGVITVASFVCNGDQPPTTGWETTSKADKDGKTYYVGLLEKKATSR